MTVRVCLLGLVAVFVAGCSGSAAPIAPVAATPSATAGAKASPAPTGSPKATATPTSTPTPAPSGSAAPANLIADQTAINAIAAYYTSLSHASAAADAASVQTFMASNADVARSGSSSVLAWAQFKDGLLYVLHLDFDAPGSDTAMSAFARSAGAAPPVGARARARLAAGTSDPQFNLLPNNGPIYALLNTAIAPPANGQYPESGIASALGALGHPTQFETASVANLGNVGADAVLGPAAGLYVLSHGGIIDDPTNAYEPFYSLATSDSIASVTQLSAQYQAMANVNNPPAAGSLAKAPQLYVGHFVNSSGALVLALGVTSEFFKQQRIALSNHAFVFLNACESDDTANPSSAVPDLVAAFASKGAETYLGWTGNVRRLDARESANFLFDRWLGESPATAGMFVGVPARENPPERPFSLGEVLAYAATFPRQDNTSAAAGMPVMADESCSSSNASLAGHNGNCSYLRSYSTPGTSTTLQNPNLILEPSIAFLVDTDPPFTSVFGEFDDSLTGTVSIGTQPGASGVTVSANGTGEATQSTRLFVVLPQTGAGAAGYVTAAETTPSSTTALSSNTVAWTMLKGISYAESDTGTQTAYVPPNGLQTFSGSSDQTVNQSLDFRVDLHPWRLTAGSQPAIFTQFSNPFPYYPLTGNLYNAIGNLPSSSGTATVNSTETATVLVGSAKGDTSTFTLSGSATLGATCASTPCPIGSGIGAGDLIFDSSLATCGAPMCLGATGSYGVQGTQCFNPGSCTSGDQVAAFGKLTTMQLPIGLDGQGNFTGGTTTSTTCTINGMQAGGVTSTCTFTLGAGSALYLPLPNQQS